MTIELSQYHRLQSALGREALECPDPSKVAFPAFFLCTLVDYQKIYHILQVGFQKLLFSKESVQVSEPVFANDHIVVHTFLKDIYEQQASGTPIGFVILESFGQKNERVIFQTERVLAVRGGFPRRNA